MPKKDPDALANQIAHLIDHPDLAAKLAEQGRARVAESFTIETVAERTISIYESIPGDGAGDTTVAALTARQTS